MFNTGDEYESVSEMHICEHHKKYPWDLGYGACTCSAGYSMRRKTISDFQRRRNIGQARLLEVLRLNAANIRRSDLRLGQLLLNACGDTDLFNIEDDELADAIERFLNIAGREIIK